MSAEPFIAIRLDGDGRVYRPSESLSGEYRVEAVEAQNVKAVEFSVLWHTEGKGDEDMAVHEFRRWDAEADGPFLAGQPVRFDTKLPNSPLSYEGQIIRLRWCVRVRVFLHRGKELVADKTFQLGDLLQNHTE